jgi:hypothetical protein
MVRGSSGCPELVHRIFTPAAISSASTMGGSWSNLGPYVAFHQSALMNYMVVICQFSVIMSIDIGIIGDIDNGRHAGFGDRLCDATER